MSTTEHVFFLEKKHQIYFYSTPLTSMRSNCSISRRTWNRRSFAAAKRISRFLATTSQKKALNSTDAEADAAEAEAIATGRPDARTAIECDSDSDAETDDRRVDAAVALPMTLCSRGGIQDALPSRRERVGNLS